MKRIMALFGMSVMLTYAVQAAQPGPRPELKNVIIVYKTHFDIGYTDLAKNVLTLFRTKMIGKTLDVIEQNRHLAKEQQFVWTIPGWPMEQMLWPGQDPGRRKAIEQAIRDGNLAVHALPFSNNTETMEVEDLVRGLRHSSAIARTYGLPLPRGAKTTDVPEHTWLMPTVLRQAGVDFLHVGVNDATTPPQVPLMFWWEGPDGSRLLTMLTNTYGTWREPPKDWAFGTWLAILQTYDNLGPPNPDTVKKDIDYYAKNYPGAKVKVGQLADFYDAIKHEDLSQLPVVKKDMADCWIHGPASSPVGCATIAKARPLLFATEALATLNAAWGVKTADPQKAIAKAFENSLLWSEHTWGLDSETHLHFNYVKEGNITKAIPVTGGRRKTLTGVEDVQASWEEHNEYARQVQKIMAQPCADQMAALASQVAVDGKRVVVFNSLPWERDDLARVEGPWSAGVGVLGEDGKRVPAERSGSALKFIARAVPPLGYRTYQIKTIDGPSASAADCRADVEQRTIESPAFRVVFDPERGRIVSLFDKKQLREWVDDAAPQGFGYFYERFSKQDAMAYMKGLLSSERWLRTHGDALCRTGIPPVRTTWNLHRQR